MLDPFIRIGPIPSLSDRVLDQNVSLNSETLRIWKVYVYKKRKTSEKRIRRMISSLSWLVGWGVGYLINRKSYCMYYGIFFIKTSLPVEVYYFFS